MSKKKSEQRAAYEKVRDMVLEKMSGDLRTILKRPMNSVTVSGLAGEPWNLMVYIRGQDAEGVLLKVDPVGVSGVRDGLNVYGYTRAVEILRRSGHITAQESDMFQAELRECEAEAQRETEISQLQGLAAKLGYSLKKKA